MKKNEEIKQPKKTKIPTLNFLDFGVKKEKEIFIENLTMLLSSGLSPALAIDSIQAEIKSKKLKIIIAQIGIDIDDGFPLWKSLENSKLFDESIISLIRIGEDSGRLAENLKLVAAQSEKNKKFRSKLRSALMYPIFVLVLATVIGLGISWFILPRLAKIFYGMNVELPGITKFMINFGVFLGEHGAFVVPSLAIFVIVVAYFLFVHKKTKFIGQAITLSIPGVKKLLVELEITRFSYLTGSLLEAGLPMRNIMDALTLSEDNSLRKYQKFYLHLKKNVEEGKSFQQSFNSYAKIENLFPNSVRQMIAAGEQSGRLTDILLKISESYNEKTETTTKNLMVALEPLMLIIVWIAVVFVALSIILPIYSLVGNFN
ncbi:type II secretion system F family protein [Patescibacteria group bacterium]|nr:type II secretion system F family protein [Patescibacteria group bacterium]